MFRPAGRNSELIGLIASQLPEKMDVSDWSGAQGGEEIAGGYSSTPFRAADGKMYNLNSGGAAATQSLTDAAAGFIKNALGGQPRTRSLTPQERGLVNDSILRKEEMNQDGRRKAENLKNPHRGLF